MRPNFVQHQMTATLYPLHRCSQALFAVRHGGKQRRWQLPRLLWPQLSWRDGAAATLSQARESWTARARRRGNSAGGHARGFSPLEMFYVSVRTHLQTANCNVRDYDSTFWQSILRFRASFMQISAKSCACSTLDVCVFGVARASNSTQKFCNAKMCSQRRRPKFWCAARRPRREFATISPIFYRKIYAIAPLSARFFRRATRHRLALELRRRLASFTSESL